MSKKFIWVRQPSGTTTYVDHRGDDLNGDGTAQNPFQTILKATTVATAGSNIVIGDGVWNDSRYSTSKYFRFYGNSHTQLNNFFVLKNYDECYHYLIMNQCDLQSIKKDHTCPLFINCVVFEPKNRSLVYNVGIRAKHSLLIKSNYTKNGLGNTRAIFDHCIFFKYQQYAINNVNNDIYCSNCIDISGDSICSQNTSYNHSCACNFTTGVIRGQNGINNQTIAQNITDYFNYVTSTVLAAPNSATLNDWLSCDFTAKLLSANIGRGCVGYDVYNISRTYLSMPQLNSSTIGLNEGIPSHATNDISDIFSPSNGATLVNVAWNSSLNGYSLVHKDMVCAGSTSDTITLAADAESTDDYYNGLFIGITAGSGYGEIHRITDYNGTTKVATIDGTWTTQPDTQSIYSITGSIVSAIKDYGKLIRVKQNWAFCGNMQSWNDANDASYGMWKEFVSTPLQKNNGVWGLRPCSNFRYEYSINGTDWYSNSELVAGTDTDNKTDGDQYGNASENFIPTVAKATRLRYARFHIHIGFNIGQDAQ